MAEVVVDGVTKVYPNGYQALQETSLTVDDGEFVVLVGPSGSGKTTLLRMIAGLEDVTSGGIRIGGAYVTEQAPEDRDIAMVFQSYALYPSMSVRGNLGFGLRMRKVPKAEIRREVEQVAGVLGLTEYLDRRPGQLSGGQRQRVAMGRAMVRQPSVYLMDEPLSNLDAKLRGTMRAELAKLHQRLGVTTIYVTHDQVEATTLGNRVAVLANASLQQCSPPEDLFDQPANVFVAAFIGNPTMNLLRARVEDGEIVAGALRLAVPRHLLENVPTEVIFGFRPTDLHRVGAGVPADWPHLEVVADVVEALGSDCIVNFRVDAERVLVSDAAEIVAPSAGEDHLLTDVRGAALAARLSGRQSVSVGERVDLALDIRHLYFFDSVTGDRIVQA